MSVGLFSHAVITEIKKPEQCCLKERKTNVLTLLTDKRLGRMDSNEEEMFHRLPIISALNIQIYSCFLFETSSR